MALCDKDGDPYIKLPLPSRIIPYSCFNTPIADPSIVQIRDAINQSVANCATYPPPVSADGISAQYAFNSLPIRVPLKEVGVWDFRRERFGPNNNLGLTTGECEILNGSTSNLGCVSREKGTACEYDSFIVRDCGSVFASTECALAATFCIRRKWDTTYKRDCCLRTLYDRPEIGSFSKQLPGNVWYYGNRSVSTVNLDVARSQTVISVSSYDLYCDPEWCPGSQECDAVLYDVCQWSTTTNAGGKIHSALVPGTLCAEWYSNAIGNSLLSNNDWTLVDGMINNYCFFSSSGDTQSCACVLPLAQGLPPIYYSSCSEYGISSGDCPPEVFGVRPVGVFNTETENSIAVSDYVCSNLACLQAATGEGAFLSSGIAARARNCPQSVCTLLLMSESLTVNQISVRGVYVFNTSQICTSKSFSSAVPTFSIETFTGIDWFWDVTNRTLTSKDSSKQVFVQNGPVPLEATYTFFTPDWIVGQTFSGAGGSVVGTYSGGTFSLGANQTQALVFTLSEEAKVYLPATYSVGFVRIEALQSNVPFSPPAAQFAQIPFSVADINPDAPLAPPAQKPGESPDGLPELKEGKLSPGAISLLILSAVLLFFAIYFSIRT